MTTCTGMYSNIWRKAGGRKLSLLRCQLLKRERIRVRLKEDWFWRQGWTAYDLKLRVVLRLLFLW